MTCCVNNPLDDFSLCQIPFSSVLYCLLLCDIIYLGDNSPFIGRVGMCAFVHYFRD